MGAKPTPGKPLSDDQTKLLVEVIRRNRISLTMKEWDDLATDMGISNGKAAKERFRYLTAQLGSASNSTVTLSKQTNHPTPVSCETRETPTPSATKKRKVNGTSTSAVRGGKKVKTDNDEDLLSTPKSVNHKREGIDNGLDAVSRKLNFTQHNGHGNLLSSFETGMLKEAVGAEEIEGLFENMEEQD